MTLVKSLKDGGWSIPNTKEAKEQLAVILDEKMKNAKQLGLKDSTAVRRFIGKVIIGGEKASMTKVTQVMKGNTNFTQSMFVLEDLKNQARNHSLKQQTSKKFLSKYKTADRLKLKLKGQQDHHMLFRNLFEKYYEGLSDVEADELTEYLLDSKLVTGNLAENLEWLDEDLHTELHKWARNQGIDAFSPKTPDSNFVMKDGVIQDVYGGASETRGYRNPDGSVSFVEGPDIGKPTQTAPGAMLAREQPAAPLPTNPADRKKAFELRKKEAADWGELIQDSLDDKTAEMLVRQDARYGKAGSRTKADIIAGWQADRKNLRTQQRLMDDWGFSRQGLANLIGGRSENLRILANSMDNIGKLRGVKAISNSLGVGDAFAQAGMGFARGDYLTGTVAGTLGAAQLAGQSPAVQKRFAALTAELIARRGSKSALKFIPGVDIALSGAESWGYLTEGKWDQASIAALSGAIGWVPGLGDFGAALLDATNTAIDIKRMDWSQRGEAPDLAEDLPDTDPDILKRNKLANLVGEASNHYDPSLFKVIRTGI